MFPELEALVPTLHMASVYAMLSEFPLNVKQIFTSYGKESFTLFGKQFFTLLGKETFTLSGKEFFTTLSGSRQASVR